MLYYLPLEPYRERYTYYMSCKDGWTESHFKELGIQFERIDGERTSDIITKGVVLDAFGRSIYAMSQIKRVVSLLRDGTITDKDVIYTEDFWHPGIESLFYIRDIQGAEFKIGCFLHAQSVDEHDFTHDMKYWIRDIERGLSKGYDYVFTTSMILTGLCEAEGFKHINCVGLPYNSNRLIEQLVAEGFKNPPKEKYVIFSSRFDREKNPMFFMDLVEQCPDIKFKLVNPRTGRPITNDVFIQKRLDKLLNTVSNLELIDTSNKLAYYTALAGAEVQFNCALQDWVSWTLLEALTFDCKVLYPQWRDFPYELADYPECIYYNKDVIDAKDKLYALMAKPYNPEIRNKVVARHDASWKEYLKTMGVIT